MRNQFGAGAPIDSDFRYVRTGNGTLIFITPGRLRHRAGITGIALGASWAEAAKSIRQIPDRLRQLAQRKPPDV